MIYFSGSLYLVGNDFMKKGKVYRIVALIGACALIVMFIATVVVALMSFEGKDIVLQRMLVLDFIIPALLYGYSLIYKAAKGMDDRAQAIAESDILAKSDATEENISKTEGEDLAK